MMTITSIKYRDRHAIRILQIIICAGGYWIRVYKAYRGFAPRYELDRNYSRAVGGKFDLYLYNTYTSAPLRPLTTVENNPRVSFDRSCPPARFATI